ncbi:MAG TPA: hypothetical protein VNZ27_13115 [Rhodanobacter sp.]|jgi:hypothetical protein|nr:hypothetical protein [Rhodanobacter sp.]
MMLPNNPSSSPPKPATIPVPAPVVAMPVEVDVPSPMHADYNLHPLAVQSLDHYVIHIEDDERFHVR